MLFFLSLIPGWGLPAAIFRWVLGLAAGDEPGREPRLYAGEREFPTFPFRIPEPPPLLSIRIEVGDGLRARIPLLLMRSSDVDPVFRLSRGLSGTSLLKLEGPSGVRNMGTVPGSAPGSTGTPLRAMEGLRGGNSLMVLLTVFPPFNSRFLLAMRGLSKG